MAKVVKQESAWQNPWVWTLAGIMGVTLVVNAVMITLAFNTSTGLVVDDFYNKGKRYFYEEAQRQEAAARLGWQLTLDTPNPPRLNSTETYVFRALDRTGTPLIGARAHIDAFRPTNAELDFDMPMREISDGIYTAQIDFANPGKWDLIITIQKGEDRLDLARRIFVKE